MDAALGGPAIRAETRNEGSIDYEEIKRTLLRKHWDDNSAREAVHFAFLRALHMFNQDLNQAKGKKVLDLWCGSTVPKDLLETIRSTKGRVNASIPENIPRELLNDSLYLRDYEPWFCRILNEIGAIPVGIDSGHLEWETFEYYVTDLSKKGALDFLESDSFDYVIANGLLDSPQLNDRLPKREIEEMRAELLNQANRLLKDKNRTPDPFW